MPEDLSKKAVYQLCLRFALWTGTSKREDMKQLIFTLSKNIPMIRANLFGAIQRNLPEWKIKS